ncbi:MAG: YidC/Oxa1 family membrane protein insertase [Fusicatenibacter sp.]|nr:YidC/Oxa1 family membrane protein insertase [Lachnospiraceae bacterium]MDY2936972.1 YidC/Oxa1 family membrane protein insertase [Fusicatenibacter sp.]
MDIVLSKSTWPIIKYVCQLLGWLINGIYVMLEWVGIPNIGIAIILFTLVIYLILTPIQIKQQKFSKMMNVMQPEIMRIQKKYEKKKDQNSQLKQSEEMSAVYQKYGVSPTGSCLPLFVQMPILFALYQVIYHIPGYISSVRNVFEGLVQQIMNVSGYSELLTQFISDNRVTMYTKISETLTENNIFDMLYVLKPSQWEQLANISEFSGITDVIAKTAADSTHINMFLGVNITQSPMDVLQEGIASGSVLLIIGAILVPVLAWFTQWLNYKLMPTAETPSNNKNKSAGGMENSMKTMNTLMPIMSAFFCLSFSIGIGIYWIAGAVIRSVQQIIINRQMAKLDLDELVQKNQEKMAKKREKAGLPPQKITQQATQSVRNIPVQEPVVRERTEEEKAAARKEATDYYNDNQEYRPGSIASKANMVKKFDEKNTKKKK